MNDDVIPLLKWAGGKRWLLKHSYLFPNNIEGIYIEPFLGSGALFFHLNPKRAILSDINNSLIEMYVAIKDNWKLVFKYLRQHEIKHSEEYYYEIRTKQFKSKYQRAAQFIYLNRTCWNGLYRVNLKGEFNVPKGTKDRIILPSDNFKGTSGRLKNARLVSCDFEKIISEANEGDFIFADPPYTVKHNNNGFRKYNEKLFSWDDQIRLRDTLLKASEKGANVLLANASSECIIDLYSRNFEIIRIKRNSVLAADVNYRSPVEELMIRRYSNGFKS
jgi:DNA adenine methylase